MGALTWIKAWPVYRQLTGTDPLGRGAAVKSEPSSRLVARTRTADQVVKSVCPYCAVGLTRRSPAGGCVPRDPRACSDRFENLRFRALPPKGAARVAAATMSQDPVGAPRGCVAPRTEPAARELPLPQPDSTKEFFQSGGSGTHNGVATVPAVTPGIFRYQFMIT